MIPDVSFGALSRNNDGLPIVTDGRGVVLRGVNVSLAVCADIGRVKSADGRTIDIAGVDSRWTEKGHLRLIVHSTGGKDAFTSPRVRLDRGADQSFLCVRRGSDGGANDRVDPVAGFIVDVVAMRADSRDRDCRRQVGAELYRCGHIIGNVTGL